VNITVKESITIAAPPERVWDFTQDWSRRASWDPAIVSADEEPGEARVLRVLGAGGMRFTVRYKLFDRPKRTSLVMTDSNSRIVTGGGGHWEYAPKEGGTEFTEQNTLKVGSRFFAWVFGWMIRWQLRRVTRKALANAKRMIEAGA
jgi:uncharacterized protein YndB with AHSA1/START domain